MSILEADSVHDDLWKWSCRDTSYKLQFANIFDWRKLFSIPWSYQESQNTPPFSAVSTIACILRQQTSVTNTEPEQCMLPRIEYSVTSAFGCRRFDDFFTKHSVDVRGGKLSNCFSYHVMGVFYRTCVNAFQFWYYPWLLRLYRGFQLLDTCGQTFPR